MFPKGFFAPGFFPPGFFPEFGGLPKSGARGFRGAGKMYLPWVLLADIQNVKRQQAALRRSVNSVRAINAANYAMEHMYQQQMARSASYSVLLAEV